MAQVYRERDIRYTRERSRSSSGDDRHYTTTRYKVAGSSASTSTRLERIDRYDDDDLLSRQSHSHSRHRPSADIVQVDRYPDRPRSALDSSDSYRADAGHHRTVTVEYNRESERDHDYYTPEHRSRSRVYEEVERVSPAHDHYWERNHHDHDVDIHLDKRVVRRGSDSDFKLKETRIDIRKDDHRDHSRDHKDLKIERRYVEERHPHDEIEHYRREVEYYAPSEPAPGAIIIRQQMPEQKIIVHEASPVIVPIPDPKVIVVREEHRESRKEEDHHHRRREEKRHEQGSFDEDYYYKKTVVHRDGSSSSGHHKLRIAQGALAGAGITALVNRGKDGDDDHKGRKVLAGAALGALGTEVIRRARGAYEDREEDYDFVDDFERRSHRSKSRSRLSTGLAIGAAALAVAGGLKLMQDSNEKEETHRGRSRRRLSDSESEYSLSRSGSRRHHSRAHHSRSHHSHTHQSHSHKSRSKSNAAKAGAATAAVAGMVHHYRSKSRGKSKSKSRVKTGAEIAAAGLTGAAATKIWEHHQDKKHREHGSRDSSSSGSRSRSRSLGRHHHLRDSTADGELGLLRVHKVEYGKKSLESLDSASDETRRREYQYKHREVSKHEHREASKHEDVHREKRSKSKLRDVAVAGLGTGVAAIGIKKYSEHQKNKERAERSRGESPEASSSRDRHDLAHRSKDRDHRSRDREQRRYKEAAAERVYESDYHIESQPLSPPYASGGFPKESKREPPARSGSFTIRTKKSITNIKPYAPYNPQDYVNLPPPPPGPPPGLRSYSPPPGGPGYYRPGPEHVSQLPKIISVNRPHPDSLRSSADNEDGLRRPPTPSTSSSPSQSLQIVTRAPSPSLSPEPSRHLVKRRGSTTATSFSSSDSDVVDLPSRFDASGRRLDSRHRRGRRVRSRRGEIEYKPRHRGDVRLRGEWAAVQTGELPEMEQLAHTVGDMLSKERGVLGILGRMLKDRAER